MSSSPTALAASIPAHPSVRLAKALNCRAMCLDRSRCVHDPTGPRQPLSGAALCVLLIPHSSTATGKRPTVDQLDALQAELKGWEDSITQ